jgi:2',3'-cyclic-nucleotide 2'-phosphodiesterase/3'-nucleotidase
MAREYILRPTTIRGRTGVPPATTRTTSTALAIALGALLAAAAAPVCADDVRSLTILHTSDLHGHVGSVDPVTGGPAVGSLARVADLVREVRDTAPGPVLVLDSGDTLQGSPVEELPHVHWGEPSPTMAAMDRIGYDAVAVGNHEFNFGIEVLRRAERQASFPLLSANTVDVATGEPAFRPYVVLERDGVRIGVLGLTTPSVPRWEVPAHYAGLRFEPMADAARRWVQTLRTDEACDLVVVLAHTGFERDPRTGEERPRRVGNHAWELTRVEGIDLLLTGHDHRAERPHQVHGVVIAQPRARARTVTRLDLTLERHDGEWRVAGWTGELVDVTSRPLDPQVVALTAGIEARVGSALDRPVGQVTDPVDVIGCRLRDCAVLDMVHAAQLEASGADLSLTALLSDAAPPLERGPVTERWLRAMYVYPNRLVAMRLTGAQVVDVLEHAARYHDGLDCSGRGPCVVTTDTDIPRYNVDSLAGLAYRIDPTRPEGARVTDVRLGGRPLHPDQMFTVVMNTYRASGGGDYPHVTDAEIVWRSDVEVVDLLRAWLDRHRPWRPTVDGNWTVAPDLVEPPRAGR